VDQCHSLVFGATLICFETLAHKYHG
jgi:hypothetical protein